MDEQDMNNGAWSPQALGSPAALAEMTFPLSGRQPGSACYMWSSPLIRGSSLVLLELAY